MSYVEGEFVCETEKKIVATSTMTEDEHSHCRMYVMLIECLFRENSPLKEVFCFLDMKNSKRSDLAMKLFKNISHSPPGILRCFDELNRSLTEECFETEAEVVKNMEQYSDEYFRGVRGGDLLKYPMMIWIEQYNDFMDWLFNNLRELYETDLQATHEINELGKFMRCVFIDQDKPAVEKPSQIVKKFDYDFISWSQQKEVVELSSFNYSTEIFFNKTEISASSNSDIWNSFGFFLSKDFTPAPSKYGRLYPNKLRRNVGLIKNNL